MSYYALAVQALQFAEAHAPAATPFVIFACFVVAQVQFAKWRPAIVKHYAHTESIAAKLGVTAAEEAEQEKRADAELPHGMTAQEYLDALSTAAIERDQALTELRTIKAQFEALTAPAKGPPSLV